MNARSRREKIRVSRIELVPIKEMKVQPADVAQRKFNKVHGETIASDLRLEDLGYPVINRDTGTGELWIVDGQHRIYALKKNGFVDDLLECEVYEDLSVSEMADRFYQRDKVKRITPYTKFKIGVTAGYKEEVAINSIVVACGCQVSKSHEDHAVLAVSALRKVFRTHGGPVLAKTIATLDKAYDGDHGGFDSVLISGLGMVLDRYNGSINDHKLADILGSNRMGHRGVLRKAALQRERLLVSKEQCVASTIVEAYNRATKARKDKLPRWWAEPRQTAT